MVQSATSTSTTSELVVSEPSFAVDQSTGRITTTTTLDREKIAVYHLIALAIDSRNTSMSATANVTIYVADKNDNKPVITFPSAFNYTVQVRLHNLNEIIILCRFFLILCGLNGSYFEILSTVTQAHQFC